MIKNINTLLQIVQNNCQQGKPQWEGLDSSEIGAINRFYMFGENDEAYPGDEEWSSIVN